MAITLHLTPEQEAKLRSAAGQLKVSPEALAEAAMRDLLARPDDELLQAAQAIVEQDRKLEGLARGAALRRLQAGIDGMTFYSSGPLPSRDESHDRS